MANFDGSTNEYKLDDPPSDCIQSVKFGENSNRLLLSTSWDCTVKLYDVITNQLKTQYLHDAPVLDAAFQGEECIWSGGADKKVKKFDIESETETLVGLHDEPIRCVEFNSEANLVATGSWDRTMKLWDPRLAGKGGPVATHQQIDKVYTMSVCGPKLVLGTAGRRVAIWDLRNMTCIQRESFLKYQTRCISTFPDQKGYVIGSIEGRVAVEYFEQTKENQRYAFKCHRSQDKTTGLEIIYPVNAISFHRSYNTFATGGSDCFVSVWDAKHKKRLVQFHKYPTSISSLSFSPDGSMLAIACSYLHASEDDYGLRDIPQDSIFIRRVSDHEVRKA